MYQTLANSTIPQLKGVQQVHTTSFAFAAILADGSAVTWGNPGYGGDSSGIKDQLKGVQQVEGTERRYVAVPFLQWLQKSAVPARCCVMQKMFCLMSCCFLIILLIEGSLEVKLPTIWTVEKHSQEETRTWRKSEGRRSEMEKVRREKMQVRKKVGKSRNTCFSSDLWLRRVEK